MKSLYFATIVLFAGTQCAPFPPQSVLIDCGLYCPSEISKDSPIVRRAKWFVMEKLGSGHRLEYIKKAEMEVTLLLIFCFCSHKMVKIHGCSIINHLLFCYYFTEWLLTLKSLWKLSLLLLMLLCVTECTFVTAYNICKYCLNVSDAWKNANFTV